MYQNCKKEYWYDRPYPQNPRAAGAPGFAYKTVLTAYRPAMECSQATPATSVGRRWNSPRRNWSLMTGEIQRSERGRHGAVGIPHDFARLASCVRIFGCCRDVSWMEFFEIVPRLIADVFLVCPIFLVIDLIETCLQMENEDLLFGNKKNLNGNKDKKIKLTWILR